MEEKTLSITIPTYNRAMGLDRLLANLANEIEPVQADVEICVSDNGSSDDTQLVLEKWKGKLPLSTRRNQVNLGYDRNALLVMKMARGKYLWSIGDDDLMVRGSVKRLVTDLKKQNEELGIFYLNHRVRGKWVKRFGFSGFRVFRREEFDIPVNAGFGAALGFNRRLAFKVMDEQIEEREGRLYKKNLGAFVLPDFVHTYIFLECMKNSGLVGVEPDIGMDVVADVERISYGKKAYLSLIIMRCALEVRERYPGFREGYPFVGHVRSLLVMAAIATERPEFEEVYDAMYRMFLKMMRLEKNSTAETALAVWEAFRRTRAGRYLIPRLHGIVRRIMNAPLDENSATTPVILKNLEYVMADIERLL